jgi:hypothetical protein
MAAPSMLRLAGRVVHLVQGLVSFYGAGLAVALTALVGFTLLASALKQTGYQAANVAVLRVVHDRAWFCAGQGSQDLTIPLTIRRGQLDSPLAMGFAVNRCGPDRATADDPYLAGSSRGWGRILMHPGPAGKIAFPAGLFLCPALERAP